MPECGQDGEKVLEDREACGPSVGGTVSQGERWGHLGLARVLTMHEASRGTPESRCCWGWASSRSWESHRLVEPVAQSGTAWVVLVYQPPKVLQYIYPPAPKINLPAHSGEVLQSHIWAPSCGQVFHPTVPHCQHHFPRRTPSTATHPVPPPSSHAHPDCKSCFIRCLELSQRASPAPCLQRAS
jgi:hypothetical protein